MSRDFYGGTASPVEDGFAELETRFGALLARIDEQEVITEPQDELRLLVWSMVIRTRAIRLQLINSVEELMSQIELALSTPEAAKYLTEYTKANFGSWIKDAVKDRPFYQRWPVRLFLSLPRVKSKVLENLYQGVVSRDLQPLFRAFFESFRKQDLLATAGGEGHNRGLASFVDTPEVQSWFDPVCWTIEEREGLLLGDAGVVAVNRRGAVGSLLRFSGDWFMCFLPLSTTKLLVAHASEPIGHVSTDEVNRASAALSHSYFWANAPNGFSEFAELIGGAGPFLQGELLTLR